MSINPDFLPWAEAAKGIKLNGVAPQVIPGSGIGVVATRKIRINETVLKVPMRSLRTIDTVPKALSEALSGASVHGILAAEFATDQTDDFAMWKTVLPTREDFEACMPILWPKELQALLPVRARTLLETQSANFRKDCDVVLRALPELTRADYLYAWLLVNTRTFYNKMPKMQAYPKEERLVCMPVADLFNHVDTGCTLEFSPAGYSIITDRPYDASEEVYLPYGPHPNDFLLVEYGFVLPVNRWDEVCLDDVVLPHLSRTERRDLEAVGFLGRYTLDEATTGCHRTQVALRRKCCTEAAWTAFVEGEDDGAASQKHVDDLLAGMLRDYQDVAEQTLGKIDDLTVGSAAQRTLLARRWRQVEVLVRRGLETLE